MTVESSFRINQPPGTPGPEWDRARRDIVLGAVECEALNKSETSYKWEMFSAPFGVSVAIFNGTLHTCNFVLATRGGYLIRLTANEGDLDESITTLYIGVPLSNTNLCIPAANETNQDNSQSPYTGSQGWSDKAEQFYRKVDEQRIVENLKTSGSIGTVPVSDGAGNLAMGISPVSVHNLNGSQHTGIAGVEDNFMGIDSGGKPKDSGKSAISFYEPGNEISIKVYFQNSEPVLSLDNFAAFWIDTDDGNKVYLLFRRGTGDQVAVELS